MMRRAVLIGLAFGAGAVHIAIVGVLLMLHQRWIIVGTVTLGQAALLMIAGGADNIVPAQLTFNNFNFYNQYAAQTKNYTEFEMFPNRDHWTILSPGWQNIADAVLAWLDRTLQ